MGKTVSVIVPAYNSEDTIKRCIESILKQTFSDIEIIVIDDGSEDNTLSVLNGIDDERLTVISQANSGQGYARNRGMEKAEGEYIAFVDSDDTIDENMIETMYKRAKADNADVVQCNITGVYQGGHKKVQLDIGDETVYITDKGEYTDRYFSSCYHSYEVCNKLIRNSFIKNAGIKFCDTKKYFAEDLMFNLEMINHMKTISFISTPYYNYYKSENSHFHKNAKRRFVSIYKLFEKYISKADSEMKSAVSYTAAMLIIYNAGFCVEEHPETVKEILAGDELRGYIKNSFKRKCKLKHRLFLTLMYVMPIKIKLVLAKKYSDRWEI